MTLPDLLLSIRVLTDGRSDSFQPTMIRWLRAEEALEASRLVYTIVRPGGMERPQDDYKVTHKVALSPRDTLFGGQVSRLQVAELIATAVAKTDLAENKASSRRLCKHTPHMLEHALPRLMTKLTHL